MNIPATSGGFDIYPTMDAQKLLVYRPSYSKTHETNIQLQKVPSFRHTMHLGACVASLLGLGPGASRPGYSLAFLPPTVGP